MLKKRILAFFLLVGLVAAVLSACGGDGTQVEEPNNGEISSSGGMAEGGELVVGIAQDLGDSLDPYQMTAAGTREVLFNVYEGLMKPDKDGNIIPALADRDPEKSEDGLVYTFTLREHVLFHNGETVTVVDVKKSFETCAATTVDSALAAALSNVESVETPDEKTIVITLKEPNSDMLSFVASVYITPGNYEDNVTSPMGTGPFRFVSRSVQENVVLEKFEDYWGEPAHLDKVTLRIFEDSTAKMSALQSGALDMSPHLTSDQIDTLDKNQFKTLEGTMNLVQALYLNHAVEPFDNELVRQALCYAVDVDEILTFIADGHGTKVGTSIYPAFGKYFDASLADYYPHDPDMARQLLSDAGYPDGFAMTISVPNNYTPHVSTAEVIVEQLAQVGVKATIDLVEWETWLSVIYNGREFESTIVGFDASTLTAGALLARWVSGDGKNMINYSNPEYDALMQQADAAVDEDQRTALYRSAAEVLAATAANVYIQDLADFVAIKQNLEGYEFYPMYAMDFSTVYYTE